MDENDNQNEDLCISSTPPLEISCLGYALPSGLSSLYTLCKRVYPDQCNPIQANTMLKWW